MMRLLRVPAAAALLALLMLCAWGGLLSGFRREFSPERVEGKIARTLSDGLRRGVAAYWSFDDMERKSPERGIGVNTIIARGACGAGLKFDGDDDTFFDTRFKWIPGDSFSISFWMKARELPIRQDVIFQGMLRLGARLDCGDFAFDVTTTSGVQSAAFPFSGFGRFTHVAAVVDGAAGRLSLYENGVLRASRTIDPPSPMDWKLVLGRCSLLGKRHAFSGSLDEIVLWNTALHPRQIARLASAPSASRRMALPASRRFRISRYKFLGRLAQMAGSLENIPAPNVARWVRAARARKSLQCVSLIVDTKGMRRLRRAHVRSCASGHRTPAASRPVRAFISLDGKMARCLVSLGGGTLCYPHSGRPAYVIDPMPGDSSLPGGARRILLSPPETSGWLVRIAGSLAWRMTGLPSPPPDSSAVALHVNGRHRGCYVMSDCSRMLVRQGEEEDPLYYVNAGQLPVQRQAELERLAPTALPGRVAAATGARLSGEDRAALEASLRTIADALWGDASSPVPQAERARILDSALASVMRGIDAAKVSPPEPDETLLLGGNIAPWFVEGDLDLSSFRVPDGWSVSFKSDSPEWIDDSGHLLKRPEGAPVFVSLAAQVVGPDGAAISRALEFRLVPDGGAVPAMFVWTPVPLGKTHRTDAAVEIIGRGKREYFTATGSGGAGGIRYKGNTSFRGEMKLPNIKLDRPHRLLGGTETRLLVGINAHTDQLRSLNGLAYDLFRAFPKKAGEGNFAPRVKVFELFINGRYRGLLEFAERIDRDMLDEGNAAVFRLMATHPREPFVRQARPSPAEVDAMPHYDGLIAQLEAPASDETRRAVAGMLDIESAIDFQILYSLFANANGGDYRFWTLDALVWSPSRDRLFFVPWDFDLYHNREPLGIVKTNLDRWLEREMPGHRERMRERWRELRRSVLTEGAIKEALERRLAVHLGYLPSNSRRWEGDLAGEDDFLRVRDEEIAFLMKQLLRLDAAYVE